MIVSNAVEQRQQWLNGLKVGDEVAIPTGYYGREKNWIIRKIEKITPTRRMTVGNTTYDSSGTQMGKRDSWSGRLKLHELTEEVREQITRADAVSHLKRFEWKTLTTQQLLDVLKVIQQNE